MGILVIFIISISLAINLTYTLLVLFFSEKKRAVFKEENYPSVSILKPIKDLDDEMEDNIISFFELDYPDYEILFGVDSMEDPASRLIERVMQRYSHIKARIIETGHRADINPKVNKLATLEKFSSGDLYWITDSNIRVDKHTLHSLAEENIKNRAQLVFSPIRGSGSRSFGSIMENNYLSHYLSGNVLGAWTFFKKEVVVGKSMLIEKKALNSFGGFSYFKDFLAEDQVMGETFKRCGFNVSTNGTWVTNYNNSSTLMSFYSRMSRWSKIRLNMHRNIYLTEIFTNSTAIVLLLVLFDSRQIFRLFPAVIVLRTLIEFIAMLAINGPDKTTFLSMITLPFTVIVKDIILLLAWITPFFSNSVRWRGGTINIGKGTLFRDALELASVRGV